MTIQTVRDLVTQASADVRTIAAADAARLVGTADAVFVDVREASELEQTGTVEGALHVPRGLLEFQADPSSPSHKPGLDPDRRIILFCAAGGRSTLAARTLQEMGFTDVASVEGGFSALKSAGAATTRS